MKKYFVTLYPNVECYQIIVEANDEKEAKEIAEEEAEKNCYFMVDDIIQQREG